MIEFLERYPVVISKVPNTFERSLKSLKLTNIFPITHLNCSKHSENTIIFISSLLILFSVLSGKNCLCLLLILSKIYLIPLLIARKLDSQMENKNKTERRAVNCLNSFLSIRWGTWLMSLSLTISKVEMKISISLHFNMESSIVVIQI